jgi:hypothetical protein
VEAAKLAGEQMKLDRESRLVSTGRVQLAQVCATRLF